jgi:hypothetical protein
LRRSGFDSRYRAEEEEWGKTDPIEPVWASNRIFKPAGLNQISLVAKK